MAKAQDTHASEGKAAPEAARTVSAAVDAYEEALGKHGGSPCDRYVLMAVHDTRVQEAISRHIADNEMFMGAHCPAGPGIPEQARVVFEFRCLPPRICLMPSLFMAILNAFTGRVLQVVDPYVPVGEQAPAALEAAEGDRARNHPRPRHSRSCPCITRALRLRTQALPPRIRVLPPRTQALPLRIRGLRLRTRASRLRTRALPLRTRASRLRTRALPLRTRASQPPARVSPPRTRASRLRIRALPLRTRASQPPTRASRLRTRALPLRTRASQPPTRVLPLRTRALPFRTRALPPRIRASQPPTRVSQLRTRVSPLHIQPSRLRIPALRFPIRVCEPWSCPWPARSVAPAPW